jgi:hypothetical protein
MQSNAGKWLEKRSFVFDVKEEHLQKIRVLRPVGTQYPDFQSLVMI